MRSRQILAPKPEYVVNTSEFNDVKARLSLLHNRRKIGQQERSRTVRRCGAAPVAAPVRWTTTTTDSKTDQDERPTLKRRDNS